MIISSHALFDHVQGHAAMKKLTGAQVIALGGDAAALEAGQDNHTPTRVSIRVVASRFRSSVTPTLV